MAIQSQALALASYQSPEGHVFILGVPSSLQITKALQSQIALKLPAGQEPVYNGIVVVVGGGVVPGKENNKQFYIFGYKTYISVLNCPSYHVGLTS